MFGRGTTVVFNNPFVVQPVVNTTKIVEVPVFDYSQPIPVSQASSSSETMFAEDTDEPPPPDPEMERAMSLFDEARDAFKDGNYKEALRQVDRAIAFFPSDATLHEFRALCLFALKDYQEAAATMYAVLSAGPGWNWETLSSLYRSTSTYTQQLRALEGFKRENPDDAAAAFLLAYHYMTMGHLDSAVRVWERVAELLPESELTAQLLDAFQQGAG
jgi:tetratricopeptide (TPR) repeat protein